MIHNFLINLDNSRDRYARAATALAAAGLEFARVEAVDGRSDPPRVAPGFGRQVSGSEQGCRASHKVALEAFLAGDAPMAAIFEDDIAAVDAAALTSVARWLAGRGGWGVAHLSQPVEGFRSPWGQADGIDVFRAHLFPMTTGALLWSREGARTFLDHAPRDWPMDHALRACLLRHSLGVGTEDVMAKLSGQPSQMSDREALIGPAYRRRRAALRRRQKAVAAWNRVRWRFTGG